MAGMLYLPRLFVYHVSATGETSETFKVMERRLLKAIMTPAMIVTWLTGLYLAYAEGFFRDGWLHAKLTLVVIMSGVHGLLAARVRAFAEDRNKSSGTFYRVLNEVPTVLLIGIVILVIVKPF
jgi:putative membrane protein